VTTEEKFLQFHAANPFVYEALRGLVLEALAKGYIRWGIGGMYEILRWRGSLVTVGDEEFKLRNDFRAFYARLLIANGDAPENFFALRTSQADGMTIPEEDDWSDFYDWYQENCTT
jgi:hypothetical protein